MKKIFVILFIGLITLKAFSQDIVRLQKSLDSLKVLKESYQQKILEIDKEYSRIEKILVKAEFDRSVGETFYSRFSTGIYRTPDQNSLIKLLKEGSLVKVIDQVEEYYKISYNNVSGWVLRSMLISEKELKKKQQTDSIARIAQMKANSAKLKAQKELKAKLQAENEADRQAHNAELIRKYGSVNGQKIIDGKIWIGMTDAMARESWGAPSDINRTVTAFGTSEQWVYDRANTYLYFENGILTSWQD